MARRLWTALILVVLGPSVPVRAAIYVVAQTGGDFTSIQPALNVAAPGDTVRVHAKMSPYLEKIVFPSSGNASEGPIRLEAAAGERPVIDGTDIFGNDIILIDSKSYIEIVGFEIRNNLNANDGSGIRILGSGSDITVRDNRIHEIRGRNAMGITVYGTSPETPIERLIIEGNEIYHCDPHPSEALVLNGNVTHFEVTSNFVHDVNNIGIDFIGGETDINPDSSKVARDGVCRGNRVYRANQKGGGWAGGIYVDGGRDIIIEHNRVSECDLGIEIGAENHEIITSGIVVRSNIVYRNERAGLVFGGYSSAVGRTQGCVFRNNTLFENDTLGKGFGEVWIQYASGNVVENNLTVSTAQQVLVYSDAGNTNNDLDYNLWYAPGGESQATFVWNAIEYVGFDAYRAGTDQDAASIFADPVLADPQADDFHLGVGSPALDAGNPTFVPDPGETEVDGELRVTGARVDIGADEVNQNCGDGGLDPGEECDDGNPVDGDGCDSNCTVTRCGNGIVTSGEECDDGNTLEGDCCAALCQREDNGNPCDDGNLCTTTDVCSEGLCVSAEEPASNCRLPGGRSLLFLKDMEIDGRDRLVWRWTLGDQTDPNDFGDPLSSTSYALCVYDSSAGSPSLFAEVKAPAGGSRGGKPCWYAISDRGFRYVDRVGTPDGLARLVLRVGANGLARIVARGKGAFLPEPGLPPAQDPEVVVQLHNSEGNCWEARYPAPALRAETDCFRDRSD